ncbi:formyltetrahydrofolate deformylase [Raineyella sp. W15-4]|uniref:formyltetrahydrofolate deformylase n=1 Tax=Raineyella sp. W15-4 TaxID=3081651 RepID=UPI0029543FD0|nr:formyltetrahydrofolate deformylase [Raineyella sp. W15-4]WOQ18853.1 formyltetrahydrofolate deformylase [Raineyella sp. W15-4]
MEGQNVATGIDGSADQWVVTLSCKDRPGIVHKVSGAVVGAEGNITELQQFSSQDTGNFFIRLQFATQRPREAIVDQLTPVARELRASWQIDVVGRPLQTLILASRAGHCLQDLLFRQHAGQLSVHVPLVLSNHENLRELSDFYHVPFESHHVAPETKADFERRVRQVVEEQDIELVVLARYMQILSPELCDFLQGRAINIHHSFLPGFKGANPYRQAHARGVKLIGATAHFVTADLDEGPIIEQNVVRVDHADSPRQLMAIGQDVESRTLSQAVRLFSEHRVLLDGIRTIVFQ